MMAEKPASSVAKRRAAAANTLTGSPPPATLGGGPRGHDLPDLGVGHRPALERVVARRQVAGAAALDQERVLDVAMPLVEARAARVEVARRRRVDRVRHVAFEHDVLAGPGVIRV